ncbi:MAG: APC family permease [Ktedonobacteraceae bacterium]
MRDEPLSPLPVAGPELSSTREVPRLQRGALNLLDIATSTMANIAPAMSFFFSSALIAQAAGIGSPLTIVVAAIAIALLGNTLAEFSRSLPSTGSFITFIGKTFGPTMAVATTIILSLGYIIAMASVIVISGGWAQIIVQHYFNFNIPWQLLTLVFVALVFFLMFKGVHLSTQWAGYFFLLEIVVLLLVSVVALVVHGGSISLAPFNPANITGGLGGLGLGFPIAVFLFIGWENSATLAEETTDPRRNVPKAIYSSILLIAICYVFFMYATVIGFDNNIRALSDAQVPFIDVAQKLSGFLALLAYIAGFTSILSSMIAGSNSQSRLIFNAAREGLLPAWMARVHATNRTPWVSFLIFLGVGLAVVYIFGWSIDPVTFFGDLATLGTIPVALIYLVVNIALPVYYRRYHADEFSLLRHLILPVLGVLAIGFPLWGLVQPGQPAPFNLFPWISLGIIVVGLVYAVIITRRDPTLGDRVGSIIADRE